MKHWQLMFRRLVHFLPLWAFSRRLQFLSRPHSLFHPTISGIDNLDRRLTLHEFLGGFQGRRRPYPVT
jgi:hypothetical protein